MTQANGLRTQIAMSTYLIATTAAQSMSSQYKQVLAARPLFYRQGEKDLDFPLINVKVTLFTGNTLMQVHFEMTSTSEVARL